jgi:hypothetical protein
MSDDVLVAYERALSLVGESVWPQLSEVTRASILMGELSLLAAERGEERAPAPR